jgi:hypothetical protein
MFTGMSWLWGFLFLSLDEVAGIHETINSLIDMSWAVPGGIVAAGIGLAFIPFMRHLPLWAGILFFTSGALYIGGAVGLEMVGAPIDADTLTYNPVTAVKEGMEMVGVLLFLNALLCYMRVMGRGTVRAPIEIT